MECYKPFLICSHAHKKQHIDHILHWILLWNTPIVHIAQKNHKYLYEHKLLFCNITNHYRLGLGLFSNSGIYTSLRKQKISKNTKWTKRMLAKIIKISSTT